MVKKSGEKREGKYGFGVLRGRGLRKNNLQNACLALTVTVYSIAEAAKSAQILYLSRSTYSCVKKKDRSTDSTYLLK